jgi:membrane-bound serine protease (ClpP class)
MDTILTLVIVAVLIAIVVKLVRALILKTSQNSADGFQAAPQELAALAGQSGQSLSPLRPAGVALIDGQRVDVVTNGGFIESETEVEVVAVEGSRVVVRSR